MEEGRDTQGGGAEGRDEVLVTRLRMLADGEEGLDQALEAAQGLVENRQSLDELVGNALEGVLGVVQGVEAAREEKARLEQGVEAVREEKARLEEEIEELRVQKEALIQVIRENSRGLGERVGQIVSPFQAATDLMSDGRDRAREFEAHLSMLMERLEGMEVVSQGGEVGSEGSDGWVVGDEVAGVGKEDGMRGERSLVGEGAVGPESYGADGRSQEAEGEGGWAGEVLAEPERAERDLSGGLFGYSPKAGPHKHGASDVRDSDTHVEDKVTSGPELVPGTAWVPGEAAGKGGDSVGDEESEAAGDEEDRRPWWGKLADNR
jgi:hypothetical protein